MVQVRDIHLSGFMRFDEPQALTLPPLGLVLLTGINGAGKSTFMEAVSYALWGKTLRGADPRQTGVQGQAGVVTHFDMSVFRHWDKTHQNRLAVSIVGNAPQDWVFDTVSKAQDHITGTVGEWDSWRRSCAFSSVDDLSFATATDAERKRLLESLLGLSRFDKALDLARADYKRASQAFRDAMAKGNAQIAQRTEAKRALESLRTVVGQSAPTTDLASLRARLATLESLTATRTRNLADEEASAGAAMKAHQEWSGRLSGLERDLRACGQDSCPTCRQKWPDANDREVRKMGLLHDLEQLKAEEPSPDYSRWEAAKKAVQDNRDAIVQLKAELTQAEKADTAYRQAQALVKDAELRVMDMDDLVDVLNFDMLEAQREEAILYAVDCVLGTKGARAHMLTNALETLQGIANGWLEKIARVDAPLTLKLSPYTDKKSGGTSDSISMEVVGAGGGRGYKGASGGERRRIDVAIMLALAEIAQDATNMRSTMFFDEVFDSLDQPGVEAVANALDELAQQRCVVVMSHSPELIASLVPDIRVHVADGVVTVG